MDREKEIAYLMQGAYDLHMHAAPSPFHRVLDDYGLLEEAGRAGMAGIMLKSHYESTIARAILPISIVLRVRKPMAVWC